jgi:hypothetical protein
MPRVGESHLFGNSYRREFDRRLDPYGVLIEYSADRAALDDACISTSHETLRREPRSI